MRVPLPRLALSCTVLVGSLALGACGSGSIAESSTPTTAASAIPVAARVASGRLLDWPEFGLDPQRSDVSELSSGISAAQLSDLRRRTVSLPGTVDSSPIYLHDVQADGRTRNLVIVTTSYGKTLALDADSGGIVWTFTPPGYDGWAGSAQITNTSPLADPSRQWVYAASPNGLIHKLSLADGSESHEGSWPVSITRDATHEKLGAALNIAGAYVIATTSGYLGDAPPYQGHVVLIERASGHIRSVFNTLCSNRRALIVPNTCAASDSAILSRGGAVVEPNGTRILIDTGNGPWDGKSDFGDSVLELTLPSLKLRQSFTPTNQQELNASDTDLGSSAPALLHNGRVLVAGKDGSMRVLRQFRLNGQRRTSTTLTGGEAQRLPLPGGGMLFTAPAVWRHGPRTTVFLADEHATAAYVLRCGHLYRAWIANTPGTSPVMVGGLLYVYEPVVGGIFVYRPNSPHPVAKLPGTPGHWNSPVVVDGHIVEPEGDANEHRLSGTLEIFSTP